MRKLFLVFFITSHAFLSASSARGSDEMPPFPVDVWGAALQLAAAARAPGVCAVSPLDEAVAVVRLDPPSQGRLLAGRQFRAHPGGQTPRRPPESLRGGGYENLERQKRQIAECISGGANGPIVGAISADGLNDLIASAGDQGIPVVDLINGMNSKAIAARAAADFYDIGMAAGLF